MNHDSRRQREDASNNKKETADALRERIERFQLDDPDSSLTLTARLAKENGWSRGYTRRVAVEYKRYVYLVLTADHMAVPPEGVDQCWHLHLTYTHSYWQDFCRDTLGHKVHHQPTRGREEQGKFVDLYNRTLASYERVFGRPPPEDIWPAAAVRFGRDTQVRRVNLNRHWVIPKPCLPRWLRRGAHPAIVSCALLPTLALVWNPLEMRGPDFLIFYAVLFCIALLLGLVLR